MNPELIRNTAGLVGYVAICGGLAVYDGPAAVIVGGVLLLAGSILGTIRANAND